MTDEVQPVPPVDRRGRHRRERDRRALGRTMMVVPAVDGEAASTEMAALQASPAAPADPGATVFAAQLIGQKGQRRGLKGGPVVLDAARSAYLGAEFSGERDRRPKAGTKDDSEI